MIKRRPALVATNMGGIDPGALRARLTAHLYGTTATTSLRPATIARSFTFSPLPTGTARVDKFAFFDVGGRGGTTYGWLLYPTVAAIGTLAVSMTAHSGFWNVDAPHHDKLINEHLLARGCHVLCLDQPAGGNNPALYLDGTRYYDTHVFNGITEGTKSLWRVFLDQALGGLNQAILDLSPSRIVACGLSGGGLDVEMLAAIDTRIQASYSIMGSRWWPAGSYSGELYPANGDWEYTQDSPAASWGEGGSPIERHVLRSSARRGANIVADADLVFSTAGQHAIVTAGAAWVTTLLAGSGSYAVRYDTTATMHEITQDTCDWIWADVLAHT